MEDSGPIEELYREELMDHYQNPRNFGRMETADVKYHDSNPVCGDEVDVWIKVDVGKIKAAMFSGKGCAISQAAASMLTVEIEGETLRQLLQIKSDGMLGLLKINPGPVRIKCALLALRAMQKGALVYEASLLKKK